MDRIARDVLIFFAFVGAALFMGWLLAYAYNSTLRSVGHAKATFSNGLAVVNLMIVFAIVMLSVFGVARVQESREGIWGSLLYLVIVFFFSAWVIQIAYNNLSRKSWGYQAVIFTNKSLKSLPDLTYWGAVTILSVLFLVRLDLAEDITIRQAKMFPNHRFVERGFDIVNNRHYPCVAFREGSAGS